MREPSVSSARNTSRRLTDTGRRLAVRVADDVDEFKRKQNLRIISGPLNFFSGKIPILVRG
jgi:hypothetical protein